MTQQERDILIDLVEDVRSTYLTTASNENINFQVENKFLDLFEFINRIKVDETEDNAEL